MKSFLILFVWTVFSACQNLVSTGDSGFKDSSSLSLLDSGKSIALDSPVAPISTVIFDCDSGNLAKISFWKDRCHISGTLKGQKLDIDLPQVLSGSGVRYSDGTYVVWNKGRQVFIDLGNGNTFNCDQQGN